MTAGGGDMRKAILGVAACVLLAAAGTAEAGKADDTLNIAWDQPLDSFATPSSGMAGTWHWEQGKTGMDVIIVGEPLDSGTTYGTAPIEILPVAPHDSA